jgi:hypothetical protein
MTSWDLEVIALYFILVVGLGFWYKRRASDRQALRFSYLATLILVLSGSGRDGTCRAEHGPRLESLPCSCCVSPGTGTSPQNEIRVSISETVQNLVP